MEKICLNNSLHIVFPDGFIRLSKEELDQMRTLQSSPGECLRNPEKHIIVSLSFRSAGLLSQLAGSDSMIKNSQNTITRAMRSYGYQLIGYSDRQTGGKPAKCFRYAYTAQNTEMLGECCAIKEGKTFYYLHFYVRKACSEEGFRLWDSILENAVFS